MVLLVMGKSIPASSSKDDNRTVCDKGKLVFVNLLMVHANMYIDSDLFIY